MRFRCWSSILVPLAVVCALTTVSEVWGQKDKPRRAIPPQKWDRDVLRVFSPNPRSLLVGERPDFKGATAEPAPAIASASSSAAEAASGDGWSKWITPDVLADEVKAHGQLVPKQLASQSTFNGGGFREAQLHFAMVAVCMAIIAEYDGDVRWKNQAAGARDAFALAANNLRIPSDETFKQSKLRADDLETLVRGGRIDVKPGDAAAPWNNVADFKLLMKRLDVAHKERLTPWTSNKGAFDSNVDAAIHEAQIIAALGEVIQKDDYDYGGDSTFAGFAVEMQQAAQQLVEAANSNNYDQARQAAGAIYQSCEKCHGDYR